MAEIAGELSTTPTAIEFVNTSARYSAAVHIKTEPPVDNDMEPANANGDANNGETFMPKIRVTPTIKLMATPNKPDGKSNIETVSNTMYFQLRDPLSVTKVDPKRKFVCPYENCPKSYGKSSHLRSHLTWHSGIKPFVCQECHKAFTRSDELNRHSRTHTGEKPFECVQCMKKFSRSDHLAKHLATHTKQVSNDITNIKRNIPQKEKNVNDTACITNIKKNAHKKEKKLNETTCLPTFTQGTLSQTQKRAVLPATECLPLYTNIENETNQGITQDNNAEITLSNNGTHSLLNEEFIIPSFIPEIQIKEENFEDNTASDQRGNKHEEINDDEIMPEANALPILTPKTGTITTTSAGAPIKSNIPGRPYQCDQCEKAFRRQDDLTRHRRMHTGEKPYMCQIYLCNRRFMRSDHLKKHLKTHLKNR